MTYDQKVHDFALRYLSLYGNPKTDEAKVIEDFAKTCLELGFDQDDEQQELEFFWSDVLEEVEDLKEFGYEIEDVQRLGSLIFTHWQVIRSQKESMLLSYAQRQWFCMAFWHLANLTQDRSSQTDGFKGTLAQIQLVSNNCGWRKPKPAEEVEQCVTIGKDGQVEIVRYCFVSSQTKAACTQVQAASIPIMAAVELMAFTATIFHRSSNCLEYSDWGRWHLALTNTDGEVFQFTGPVDDDVFYLVQLSERIRQQLQANDLFVFDGNPDPVLRVDIRYHKEETIKTKSQAAGELPNYLTLDYDERLCLDRAAQTVVYIRQAGSKYEAVSRYRLGDKISKFLDKWTEDLFSKIEGDSLDVLNDPLKSQDYSITIETKYHSYLISGTFDQKGLPSAWPQFIQALEWLLAVHSAGDLFDQGLYGKTRRRQSDYIFCHVEFEYGTKTYCYLADQDDYQAGDLVVVPVGADNREVVVRIASVEYCSAQNAPYPIEKTKHILRKYDRNQECLPFF